MVKRRIVIIAWELVLLLLCGFLMVKLQSRLFYRNADREIELTLEDTDRIVAQTDENASNTYDSYELIHQAKAKMARYYIRNDVDTGYSTVSMSNLKSLLNVKNVLFKEKYLKEVCLNNVNPGKMALIITAPEESEYTGSKVVYLTIKK